MVCLVGYFLCVTLSGHVFFFFFFFFNIFNDIQTVLNTNTVQLQSKNRLSALKVLDSENHINLHFTIMMEQRMRHRFQTRIRNPLIELITTQPLIPGSFYY